MRAAATIASERARNWQSQRVTPRSGALGTTLHPEPAHRGQTSFATFIGGPTNFYYSILVSFTLHRTSPSLQPQCAFRLCTSCGVGETIVENSGKDRRPLATR